MEFLSEYDFDIKHIKGKEKHIEGKENKVADALSRRVHDVHVTTISMYSSDLKRRILEAVTTNQHYVQMKGSLQQRNVQ
jgi:hypothetical protein